MKTVSPVFGLEAKVKFVEGSQSKNAGASACTLFVCRSETVLSFLIFRWEIQCNKYYSSIEMYLHVRMLTFNTFTI